MDEVDRHEASIEAGVKALTDAIYRPTVDDVKAVVEDAAVNHPAHYNAHPSGVECITVVEHMTFNLGNAVKYIWRADMKGGIEDLRKAGWYIAREIELRGKGK